MRISYRPINSTLSGTEGFSLQDYKHTQRKHATKHVHKPHKQQFKKTRSPSNAHQL